MQRGRTPTLPLTIVGLDMSEIIRVDFLFKQDKSEECETLVLKTWPSTSVDYEDGVFYLRWTEEETRVFAPNKNFFLDTRPVDNVGNLIETVLLTLSMNGTLFKEDT